MDLRLDLATIDFPALVERARAMIPALEPAWTDHNIHDPGIMLAELMAWTAEAQIYSLSRLRRDERIAYARMLGIERAGPRPAAGLVWPLSAWDKGIQQGTIFGQSLAGGTPVTARMTETPAFRLMRDQYLTGAALESVKAISADGRTADYTQVNRADGATFLPFGERPSAGDRLVLHFTGVAIEPGGKGAITLGFQVHQGEVGGEAGQAPSRFAIAMRDASGERPLSLLADTTVGLRQSGIIAIDISPDEQDRSESWFQLILRPRASGLHWPPRLVRLAANVLAVEQAEAVTDLQQGTGLPGQNMRFSRTGRMTDRPLTVTSAEGAASGIGWEARPKLDDSGPADRHYVLDTQRNQILFGNGINGLAPPADAALTVDYEVCTGVAGNIARGMEWSVRGVAGTFGVNAEPFSGASDGIDIDGLQAAARSSLSQRKVHVTSGDLEAAALALDWLNVARAHELPPLPSTPRGLRSLLVVAEAAETDTVAETPTWLAAIRSELAPGLPLGEHLRLIAPRSIGLRIRARLTVAETATAEKVDEAVAKLLRSKFMAPAPQTHSVWPFGRDVAALTVKGWLRGIKNVVRVADLQLLGDGVPAKGDLALSAIELPRWENVPGDIVVERQRGGGWL